jgi:hypothetical protein
MFAQPLGKNDTPVDPSRRRELPPPPRLRPSPRSREPSPQPSGPGTEVCNNVANNGNGPHTSPPGLTNTGSIKRRGGNRTSYEAYEERTLPALKK